EAMSPKAKTRMSTMLNLSRSPMSVTSLPSATARLHFVPGLGEADEAPLDRVGAGLGPRWPEPQGHVGPQPGLELGDERGRGRALEDHRLPAVQRVGLHRLPLVHLDRQIALAVVERRLAHHADLGGRDPDPSVGLLVAAANGALARV